MKARFLLCNVLLAAMFALAQPMSANAQTHNGYIDWIGCTPGGCSTSGWVCRIWYPQYTYLDTIEIYEDGPYGSGTLVYSNNPTLNVNRTDTASYCNSQTYNGFNLIFFWSNPTPYRQYYIYIRDSQSGSRQLLNPAPFTPSY